MSNPFTPTSNFAETFNGITIEVTVPEVVKENYNKVVAWLGRNVRPLAAKMAEKMPELTRNQKFAAVGFVVGYAVVSFFKSKKNKQTGAEASRFEKFVGRVYILATYAAYSIRSRMPF